MGDVATGLGRGNDYCFTHVQTPVGSALNEVWITGSEELPASYQLYHNSWSWNRVQLMHGPSIAQGSQAARPAAVARRLLQVRAFAQTYVT